MKLENVLELVKEKVKEIGEEKNNKALINCNEHTSLYSPKGYLDSLTLVFLISEIEEEIENRYKTIITLADEKAMSQKISPFRSVNSLVNYIFKLLKENE